MNAPDSAERVRLSEGELKVTVELDQKIPNAATFRIAKEDHTLGNLLRMQLLRDPKVLFAGYKLPHPLESYILVKVQTTADTTPAAALTAAIDALSREFSILDTRLREALQQRQQQAEEMQQ